MRVILRFREWALASSPPTPVCVEWIVQHLQHKPIFDPSALSIIHDIYLMIGPII